MRIVALSDIHENFGIEVPSGQLFVMAGDLCERSDESFAKADEWFASIAQGFERAIYVPGNHDAGILLQPRKYQEVAPHLLQSMLVDETTEIGDLRLHAMPWERGERLHPESRIPEGLDVLVTHEPPYGILDWSPKTKDVRLGNRDLLKRVETVKPRFHIFGHCHMAYGREERGSTTFVNVSICGDERAYYKAAHPATIIEMDGKHIEVTQWR